MYTPINTNVALLLNIINRKEDVQAYVYLTRELPKIDVRTSREFQRKYRRYWALNAAMLSEDFLTAYFQLLEQSKRATVPVTVEDVSMNLLETPINSTGKRALHFSFASKLVHMINPRLPVYDSAVQKFYFLPKLPDGDPEDKLEVLLRSYQFLRKEQERILREELLAPAIKGFRSHFAPDESYTDEKIIDTLIWKFVGFLSNGALRDGHLIYR